jgi:hypothetical protein
MTVVESGKEPRAISNCFLEQWTNYRSRLRKVDFDHYANSFLTVLDKCITHHLAVYLVYTGLKILYIETGMLPPKKNSLN